jgi:nicotinamidase-related amidase
MENNKTALLVMDMQMGILARLPQQGAEIVKNIAGAINAARKKDILVIFVRLGLRKGFPEISAENKVFSAVINQFINADLDAFMQVHHGLGIIESDIIVNKKRVSAFSGSDLEMILRAKNISHLVLTGIATSGIVLSTLREAFDKDYQLTVLSDGCTDSDEEVHQFLIKRLFPKQARVMIIDDWEKNTL